MYTHHTHYLHYTHARIIAHTDSTLTLPFTALAALSRMRAVDDQLKRDRVAVAAQFALEVRTFFLGGGGAPAPAPAARGEAGGARGRKKKEE